MPAVPQFPPRRQALHGGPRRVGIELEFSGLSGGEVAEQARELFGGAVEERDPYRHVVLGSSLGDLIVELDLRAAHPDNPQGDSVGERVMQAVHSAVGAVGSLIMPQEVVVPPLPIERLPEVDRLVEALRHQGAIGTRRNILHAFGLHLNPEIAAADAGYLLDHLRAFALLSPWLRAVIEVNLSRRLSPFTRPYPPDYVRRLAQPDYRPDLRQLIADYLDANPNRDRELDMLPIFVGLEPELVMARASVDKVKARPTFHYRLPDSNVDQPGWGVVADWNRWVEVERLAADPPRLAALARTFAQDFQGTESPEWVGELQRRLAA
ncbi:MAG: amidoligase family protein [Geminicoccaceae bacterium]